MRNITLKNVRKSFGSNVVLSDVNLAVPEGSRIAIVGGNGVGKSTLLKIVCGELEPDAGDIYGFENDSVYISQDFSGDPDEAAHDFLCKRTAKIKRALVMLQEAGFNFGKGEERLYAVRCGDLSGGEQKNSKLSPDLLVERGSSLLMNQRTISTMRLSSG